MARVTCTVEGYNTSTQRPLLRRWNITEAAGKCLLRMRSKASCFVFTSHMAYSSTVTSSSCQFQSPRIVALMIQRKFTPRLLLRRRVCPARFSRAALAVAPGGDVHTAADGGVSSRQGTKLQPSKFIWKQAPFVCRLCVVRYEGSAIVSTASLSYIAIFTYQIERTVRCITSSR